MDTIDSTVKSIRRRTEESLTTSLQRRAREQARLCGASQKTSVMGFPIDVALSPNQTAHCQPGGLAFWRFRSGESLMLDKPLCYLLSMFSDLLTIQDQAEAITKKQHSEHGDTSDGCPLTRTRIGP